MTIDNIGKTEYQDSLPFGLPSAGEVEQWANAYFP